MSETTELSADGQVKIPARIREDLNIKPGDKFDVLTRDGEIILRRRHTLPGANELSEFLAKTKKTAGSKVVEVGGGRKGA
jgi:AbrB family looped-hinge helix DNA binding protein